LLPPFSQIIYSGLTAVPFKIGIEGLRLASIPIPRTAQPSNDLTWRAIALCERLTSVALLTVASPVLVGSAIAVSLLSGRTPLIAHRRVGWNGAPLWMLKLRTMWGGEVDKGPRSRGWIEYIQDETGPECKEASDPRVTSRFASFCRRHSIDELPQLWHVVRGEMALVGPRPLTAAELRRYYGEDAEEMLWAKPGIAGLWQVSGRNRLTYRERRELDLQLVRNRSVGMYLRILLRTLPEVCRGSNSW